MGTNELDLQNMSETLSESSWKSKECVLFCYNHEEYVAGKEDEAAKASNDRSTGNFTLCVRPRLAHKRSMSRSHCCRLEMNKEVTRAYLNDKKPTTDVKTKALRSVYSDKGAFATK